MLLSSQTFRPKVFFTSKEGTTLASHPFRTGQTKVIIGGVIPNRYLTPPGQDGRNAMISETTKNPEIENTANNSKKQEQQHQAKTDRYLTQLALTNTEQEETDTDQEHDHESQDWGIEAKSSWEIITNLLAKTNEETKQPSPMIENTLITSNSNDEDGNEDPK